MKFDALNWETRILKPNDELYMLSLTEIFGKVMRELLVGNGFNL
jgi:hypothetical protein